MENAAQGGLALGTAQIGQNYGIANIGGVPGMDDSLSMLKTAAECGYEWLDTAGAYGQSEKIIGDFLRKNSARIRVITKVPPISGTDAGAFIQKSVQKSMDEMGREPIKGILLHDAEDYGRFGEEVPLALVALREDLKIPYVGLSLYEPPPPEHLSNPGPCNAYQIPLNIFDHRFISFLETGAADERTPPLFFIRSVFLQGLFFAGEERIRERVPEALPYVDAVWRMAQEYETTVQELCLGFVKRVIPEHGFPVLGADGPDQIRHNASLWGSAEIEEALYNRIRREFADIPSSVRDPRTWSQT